ncbi:MAG: LCP family protein [Clostridia bacterium]|nr:LCP family protein [Clostridia bacterium]
MGRHVQSRGKTKKKSRTARPENRRVDNRRIDDRRLEQARRQDRRVEPKKKKKKKRKFLRRFLFFLIILITIAAGIAFAYLQDKLGKINYVEVNKDELGISDNVTKGYRNIALFAVDTRNIKSNDGSRSDGIIVLSINEKTKDVKMLSVYRDTYVQIEGHGLTKITHAYAYGGPTLAIKTLNQNLDLNISEYITVNFDAVATAIDEMGGIEVEIKKDEVGQMNEYIRETAQVTGKKSKSIPSAGTYNLDGVQAVTYGRIRKTDGGDYKRTERMRTVIMKTFEKAKKMDLGKLNNILDKVLPKFQTNMTSGDIIGLATQVGSYKISENLGWPYDTKGKTLDAWYGIPVTLESNVTRLHKELFGQEDYTPSETVKNISTKIINKTGYKEGTK